MSKFSEEFRTNFFFRRKLLLACSLIFIYKSQSCLTFSLLHIINIVAVCIVISCHDVIQHDNSCNNSLDL